jgi:hypothetical protein
MSGRYKGWQNAASIKRDFPYVVELQVPLAASERAWTAFMGFTLDLVSTHGEVAAAAKVSAILFAGALPMPKLRKLSQTNSVA